MALLKIKDFDPDYVEAFDGKDLKGYDVYTQGNSEKIGTVDDIMVDENTGDFRYLLVGLGVGTIGKKVLLPVGRARMTPNEDRIYASLTKEQANHLPELEEKTAVDYDYEEQVRGVYRPDTTAATVTPTAPVIDTSAPVTPAYSASTPEVTSQPTNRDTYSYQNEPDLYAMNDTEHSTLKLYEERLVANKQRRKTGEVAIGKHVETETARVSIPVEKERVVIERTTPADAGRAVSPGSVNFSEGEAVHMDIYEETPDIRKEAFVSEEVRVSKVVEQETVEAQETLRREELDIDADGRPVVDNSDIGRSNLK